MEVSIIVAKIAAILYLATGISALSKKMNYEKILKDFQDSQALTFITGFISIMLGMILIEVHNFWVKDWTVLVTIIGWAAVIKGVLFIVCPKFMMKFKGMYKNPQTYGIAMLAIGILFGYLGFFA